MSSNTTKILDKIKAAEAEIEKLMSFRKEEIYNVLHASGGITLDNKLLAGLAIYVADPANKNSTFLRELSELGKITFPRRRNKKKSSKPNSKTDLQ